jgi:predicted PurR-regulated permease PerM
MPLLQTPRDRAVALITVLAAGITIALTPFLSGLLGAAVLYVIFAHPYRWLARFMRPGLAAAIILVAALIVLALPITWLIGLVIGEAPDALRRLQGSDLLARVSQLHGGQLDIGAEIAKSSGTLISWVSSHLVAFAGGATSAALNIVIAFFGLYYILLSGNQIWAQARTYIPFSAATADALRDRFFGVTAATLGVTGNVDNLIRPYVYKRVSNIHPMITLVGAFAGVRYFGLLGLVLGPLAIAYLFELLRFYREEYATGDEPLVVAEAGVPAA